MEIISNSSPLISFSSIGELSILKKLFPEGIIIPEAVWQEVTAGIPGKEELIKALEEEWLKIIPITKTDTCDRLIKNGLDKGEAEAITLSYEKNISVLLDETEARQEAKSMKLSFTGTVGCLLKAKKDGFISEIKPYLDSMIKTCYFRISSNLYSRILNSAGEKTNDPAHRRGH